MIQKYIDILIIDDEINIIKSIMRALNKSEYRLSYATQPEKGLELIQNYQYDIVICDQRMPNITGIDIFNQLRKTSPKTIRILITGYSDINTAIHCINEGSAFRYIEKPWDNDQLITIIHEAMDYKANLEAKESMLYELLQENIRQKIYSIRLNQKINKNKENVINCLLKIMKARDIEIYKHGLQVADYALMLADVVGLSDSRKVNLKYAGYFHDIGKIAIREDILYKSSKLDDDEFNLIKNHSVVGAEILSEFDFMKDISTIVCQHHEKLSGKGYPNGLSNEEILLEAKIIAIADCYDALTSDRVYRREMKVKEAIEILQQEIGRSYDGDLVNKFIEILLNNQEYKNVIV